MVLLFEFAATGGNKCTASVPSSAQRQGDRHGVLARQLLRDPYWPLHAARELGADGDWPV
ncbi:MAG: hypothetical protein ACJ8AD_13570 [Gemmatimonadaceae bacterium]